MAHWQRQGHVYTCAGTCAGMRYPEKQALAIQYHPEASPGPHDADICFDEFVDMMKAARGGVGAEPSVLEAF
jgi:carbamoyl-phosphate synthase small subunit